MGSGGSMRDLYVKFHGPPDSPYAGGVWKVHVTLPAEYPYKSPSIGFCNRIFHPNVDEPSGSVCLDVINQAWSPMYDLVNVFQVFLPQLLLYPNPADPLNGEAASLALRDKSAFDTRVREHVRKHASVDFALDAEEDDSAPAACAAAELSDADDDADDGVNDDDDDDGDGDRIASSRAHAASTSASSSGASRSASSSSPNAEPRCGDAMSVVDPDELGRAEDVEDVDDDDVDEDEHVDDDEDEPAGRLEM